LKETLERE